MLEYKERRKLYVLVCGDLPLGLRAAQAGHAIAEALLEFPQAARDWNRSDNYLIVLEVANEKELRRWRQILIRESVKFTDFQEPDLGFQMTALAALPDPHQNQIFRPLPLAYSWEALVRTTRKRIFGL